MGTSLGCLPEPLPNFTVMNKPINKRITETETKIVSEIDVM